MSLRTDIEKVAEGLIDLHVGLNRARHFACELGDKVSHEGDCLMELYEELDQMQLEIERLMKEVE